LRQTQSPPTETYASQRSNRTTGFATIIAR